jgi:hypothetical protein
VQRSSCPLCGVPRGYTQGLRGPKFAFVSTKYVSPYMVCFPPKVMALFKNIVTKAYFRLLIVFMPLACWAYNLMTWHTSNGSVPGSKLIVNITVAPQDPDNIFNILLIESNPPHSFFVKVVGPPTGMMINTEIVIPVDAPIG